MPRQIPLEDFFRKPDKVMLRLSPSGKHLAYLEPHRRRLNLFVRDLSTGETRRLTESTERDLGGFTWAWFAQLSNDELANHRTNIILMLSDAPSETRLTR